ncbi:MAG: bifunctional riboflavin kinase/FAD synthetase [Parachlamydia sp.]|nr:bifunctional riboflavin kinase/FAD synthetase [Parachlamydia sp.]
MMRLVRSLETFESPSKPIALTVGFFDGVHLGHRQLLQKLKSTGLPVVITFENHPAQVLRPDAAPPRLCTTPHKLKLLQEVGVESVILLNFTREMSLQSAEEFLQTIRKHVPFHDLLLGSDATLGKEKHGDRQHVQSLAKELRFKVAYLDLVSMDGGKVSSSAIREYIRKGDLTAAESMLGRKFSIYAPVRTGAGLGKTIGFPTLNLPVEGLCLPPLGVYAVRFQALDHTWKGVANLGIAPTVHTSREPILEVHLFDYDSGIANLTHVEVTFEHYLRPEKKFDGLDSLKAQIAHDVLVANDFLK